MPGKLRILLVAYCFPPMNSIASHRPYGWARAWCDLGHEVHVLTTVKHRHDGPMDLECDLSGIRVHEAAYLPGRASAAGGRPAGPPAAFARWERLKTATRRLRFGLAMFGDPRLAAHFALVREGSRLMRSHGIDLIIATSPPEVAFFAARSLSGRSGVPWVADYRDLWFQDMRFNHWRLASWLSGIVHRRLVGSAAALVTVSAGLRKRLSDYLGREVLVSYNGYLDNSRLSPPRPWGDDHVHIVYTGRVYPGNQDPEALFRALAALPREPRGGGRMITVDFYGFENPWLRDLVARYRLEDRVRQHGFVPHRESLAAQRAADALLFLDWIYPAGEGVLTGKLFEYFGSGRPIMALGRGRSEAAELIAQTGCGVTLRSEEEINAYLRALATQPPPTAAAPVPEWLSRRHQARVVLDELRSRIDPRGGARRP